MINDMLPTGAGMISRGRKQDEPRTSSHVIPTPSQNNLGWDAPGTSSLPIPPPLKGEGMGWDGVSRSAIPGAGTTSSHGSQGWDGMASPSPPSPANPDSIGRYSNKVRKSTARQPSLPGCPPPTGAAKASGRKKAGNAHEKVAEALHARCLAAGVAWVAKIDRGLRILGPGKFVPVGKGTVDFLGVLRGGRLVAIECKGVESGRLTFSQLAPQQQADLATVDRLGGLALVLLVAGPAEVYAVPWNSLLLRLGEAKSIGVNELESYRVDMWKPYLERWL